MNEDRVIIDRIARSMAIRQQVYLRSVQGLRETHRPPVKLWRRVFGLVR